MLFTTAPLVGGHFEDPRVTNVIRLLSLRAVVGGFQNIGVVTFRRELRFGREFQFGIVKKSATFVVTLVAAFVLRSYWALVIGQVVGRIVEVGVSYVMSDYRPRLSLRKVGDLWGFSRWLILARFSRLAEPAVRPLGRGLDRGRARDGLLLRGVGLRLVAFRRGRAADVARGVSRLQPSARRPEGSASTRSRAC